jgi:hypothetical protein
MHWGQGCRPKFRVRYSDGTEEWHDVMRDAGTTIRQADGRVTQRPVPHLVMSRAGHGTEMEVEWVVRRAETWYQGVIVALDSERGVAIRYTTASGPSVAWHTQEDLDQRGHVITTLREKDESTNVAEQVRIWILCGPKSSLCFCLYGIFFAQKSDRTNKKGGVEFAPKLHILTRSATNEIQ